MPTELVQGRCAEGFGPVADTLAASLARGSDIGASVGVYQDGRPVVDIWGGWSDPERRIPWVSGQ